MWSIINETEEFESIIENEGVVCLEFKARWGPYDMPSGKKKRIVMKNSRILFKTVDVDLAETKGIVNRYNVMCSPTYVLLKDGEMVGKVIGACPKKLRRAIRNVRKLDMDI